jgi:hypothetical protein
VQPVGPFPYSSCDRRRHRAQEHPAVHARAWRRALLCSRRPMLSAWPWMSAFGSGIIGRLGRPTPSMHSAHFSGDCRTCGREPERCRRWPSAPRSWMRSQPTCVRSGRRISFTPMAMRCSCMPIAAGMKMGSALPDCGNGSVLPVSLASVTWSAWAEPKLRFGEDGPEPEVSPAEARDGRAGAAYPVAFSSKDSVQAEIQRCLR